MDPVYVQEQVYIALGSNLGDRAAHFAAALGALRETEGVEVVAVSPVYETDPVGPPPQHSYLNAAVQLRTRLTAADLLVRLLEIEAERGRSRGSERNAPRSLDLDLLLFGGEVLDSPGLEVPHPRLSQRPFVLEPLCDLAPQLVHPVLGETIEDLASRVRNPAAVRRSEN